MQPTVTLLNLSCARRCHHCSYGDPAGVTFSTLTSLAEQLMAAGHPVHFYDMHVTRRSLELFRLTGQFERANPGWLNVNADFDPSDDDLAYLNGLRTNLVISLHGATAESHALLANDPDDFDAVIAAVKRLRPRLTIPLGINSVLHRNNIAELEPLLHLALMELGVDFVEVINLGYGGTAARNLGASYALDRDSFLHAYQTLRRLRRRFKTALLLDSQWGLDPIGLAPSHCHLFAEPIEGHYCNAGLNHLALRSDNLGVWACPTLVTSPELRIGSFRNGALALEQNWQDQTTPLGEPCASCQQLQRCRGGPRCIAIADQHLLNAPIDPAAGFESCLVHAFHSGGHRLSSGQ